jgi:hypothetical protein
VAPEYQRRMTDYESLAGRLYKQRILGEAEAVLGV